MKFEVKEHKWFYILVIVLGAVVIFGSLSHDIGAALGRLWNS